MRQILVSPDRDVLIVNVGNAVLAWKAGPIGKGISSVKGQHRLHLGSNVRKKKNAGGKWLGEFFVAASSDNPADDSIRCSRIEAEYR